MKLVLANNQSSKFKEFYNNLSRTSSEVIDYTGYSSLLYIFDSSQNKRVNIVNIENNKSISEYKAVYINGYLNTYELAAATAVACDYLNIAFVNQELSNPPSLSKLSMYCKLAALGVPIPKSIGGTKNSIVASVTLLEKELRFPVVLKRADADRGVDNYKVKNSAEVKTLLEQFEPRSLWIIQEFVENNGFYLVSLYNFEPKFCIFRSLEARTDGNKLKAHMFKPKGGANASLIEISDVPTEVITASINAAKAMNRQIASVDSLYDTNTKAVNVLEVNYNPQLVSIETFKDVRTKAFQDFLNSLGI